MPFWLSVESYVKAEIDTIVHLYTIKEYAPIHSGTDDAIQDGQKMWRSLLIILHFRRFRLCNFSEEVKATLWNLIDEMIVNLSDFTVHPGKDFTRKKKWDFPTNASFNQRKAQIRSDAFKYLFTSFTAQYNKESSLFNGYRLIACDGSDINIAHNPNDEESYFTNGKAKGFNQLHLNALRM